MTAGYSGTPLARKLGVGPTSTVRLVGAPEAFEDVLAAPDGATVRRSGPYRADVVVVFVTSYADLAKRVPALGEAVFPAGSLWVAWPKKASGVPTDVTEDSVREVALPLGLVDNKVCAVTDVWSGLRLVWRKERRA
ncbi:MAG TPA: DUF3052 domain-containing protein [Mycobacteriales bacterium]|jgi:hypothetical protein|nr:DUF3052 domain-containing protein [Mycobacteriales bacterium]